MLSKVQKDGSVFSKGHDCVSGMHIPEHISGFVDENGVYREFPDYQKRYTRDCTPVYDENGRVRLPKRHKFCLISLD